MKNSPIILLAVIIGQFFFIGSIYGDEVYFKEGKGSIYTDELYSKSGYRMMKGLIVENVTDRIILSTVNGEIIIPKSDILQVLYDRPEYNHLYLGDQYINAHEFDKAVQEYKEALKVNPEFPEAADAIVRALEAKLRLQAKQTQEIGSIGIEIKKSDEEIKVVSVAAGSDAEKQGIKKEDLLLFIWDKPTRAMELDAVRELLTGPLTSSAKVAIERQVDLSIVAKSETAKFVDSGIRLKMELPGLMAAKVIKNSPADISGIKPDDLIVNIDGKSTRYMKLNEAKERIKGLAGKQLRLTIRRTLHIIRDQLAR